jgi:predicted methyltransferase
MINLMHGDCLEVLRTLPDNSVDSVVTDPPYGLSFMGKKWDYDVPASEVWAECLRVLKPGGHLLAFAGTRTQHRMAVRIEDAAAAGELPEPARDTDAAAAGVALSAVAGTVAANYQTCHENTEQLRALQAWVRDMASAIK